MIRKKTVERMEGGGWEDVDRRSIRAAGNIGTSRMLRTYPAHGEVRLAIQKVSNEELLFHKRLKLKIQTPIYCD